MKPANSILSPQDIEDFYIVLYFGNDDSYEMRAIKRAYRDFSRTLRDFKLAENDKTELKEDWHKFMLQVVQEVTTTDFSNQENFDEWHKIKTKQLQTSGKHPLTIGQAQKWINMTLKYSFVLGETRIKGIKKNYELFHVAIDNIIQGEFVKLHQLSKIEEPWSAINDYDTYMNYQTAIRKAVKPDIPFEKELLMFNRKANEV
jgi:hypothetical protein